MGRLLSPQRLAAIARRWEANMPEQVLVLPVTQLYDDAGAETDRLYPEPTASGLTSYRCRSQSAAPPTEGLSADQERAVAWWDVQLPVQSRIDPTDRLYLTGHDAKGGTYARLLEVFGPTGPRTWEAVRIVKCWEILPTTATTV